VDVLLFSMTLSCKAMLKFDDLRQDLNIVRFASL
jgi:hypothetical protein